MHVLKSEDYLPSVEPCSLFAKWLTAKSMQVEKQFTSVDKLHHHVEIVRILEGILHLHDEWVVKSSEDISLSYHRLECLE